MLVPLIAALVWTGHLGRAQVADDTAFYAFCDQLAMAETQVQIDHFDLIAQKQARVVRRRTQADLKSSIGLVERYEAKGLTILPNSKGYGDAAKNIRARLDDLVLNCKALEEAQSRDDGKETRAERSVWDEHSKTFHRVLSACWKLPNFSQDKLNQAAFYNVTPRLHEEGEFPILADPAYPGEARVWRTFGDKDHKLKKGDTIVGYWMPDDKKWIDVKTWREIMAAPIDAADEITHLMLIKVRRGGNELQESVSFVAQYEDSD